MATELEIKYAVGDLQLLDCMLCDPMIREKMHTGAFRNVRMETTYYDTQDGAFSARKWTYRLRRENERTCRCGRARNDNCGRSSLRACRRT